MREKIKLRIKLTKRGISIKRKGQMGTIVFEKYEPKKIKYKTGKWTKIELDTVKRISQWWAEKEGLI